MGGFLEVVGRNEFDAAAGAIEHCPEVCEGHDAAFLSQNTFSVISEVFCNIS